MCIANLQLNAMRFSVLAIIAAFVQSLPNLPDDSQTPPSLGAARCCFSKWGDKSQCGRYPAGGHGGLCSTDWTKSCTSAGLCPSGPPAPPTPSPPTPPGSFYPFATPADTSVKVHIQTGRAVAFNHQLIGVNTNGHGLSFHDPRMDTVLAQSSIPQVRFPGGSVANLYDWETDTFYPGQREQPNPFYFSEYAQAMVKHGISSMLVFNVITDSVEKSVARLINRTASGLTIDFVEAGNENYNGKNAGGGRLNGSNPHIYVKFCGQLSKALKSSNPKTKVAAVMSPWAGFKTGGWNDVVASSSPAVFDAVVMHPYTGVGHAGVVSRAGARKVLQASVQVQSYIREYLQHFTQPLLLTEWGVCPSQHHGQWLCSLMEADVFVSTILQLGRKGTVQQASKHILFAGRTTMPATLFALNDEGVVVATPSGVWYSQFAKLLRGATLFKTTVNSPNLEEGLSAVSAAALRDADGHIRILAVNKMNVNASLELTIDGVTGKGIGVKTFRIADMLG